MAHWFTQIGSSLLSSPPVRIWITWGPGSEGSDARVTVISSGVMASLQTGVLPGHDDAGTREPAGAPSR